MIEIPLAIYHYGNGTSVLDALFNKIPIDEHQSTWSKDKLINSEITVVQDGGFIRESKFAIQDIYIKFFVKELNSINIDSIAEYLFEKLSKNKDVKNIGIRNSQNRVSITKDDIKKALEEYLENS